MTVYSALPRLLLGLVATIGFLGQLAFSLMGAQMVMEFVWPLLGFTGVVLQPPSIRV